MYTGLNNLGLTGLATSFSPSNLFTNGEGGAHFETYDPTLSTALESIGMWQDSTGTTPVTAVEQPVGLWLDSKQGLVRGAQMADASTVFTVFRDATTSTPSAPIAVVTSGQWYELMFTITAWNASTSNTDLRIGGVPISGVIFQNGISGRIRRIFLATSTGNLQVVGGAAGVDNMTFTAVSLTPLQGNHASQSGSTKRPLLSARVNLFVGSATLTTQNVTTAATSYVLSFTGSGTVTLSGTATGAYTAGTHTIATTAGTLTATVTGTVTLADLRTSDDAAKNIPAYQRVNTSTDYDTTGFPHYLKFDATDDCLQTGLIDLTAFDKLTVWTGATKNSDASAGIVAELSPNVGTNNGSFYVAGPGGTASATWAFAAKGTSSAVPSANAAAPDSAVICGTADLSGPLSQNYRNGVLAQQSTAALGGGTFGNWNLNIGGRNNGTSLVLNGSIQSITVRTSITPTDSSSISSMNRYAGNLMKIFF